MSGFLLIPTSAILDRARPPYRIIIVALLIGLFLALRGHYPVFKYVLQEVASPVLPPIAQCNDTPSNLCGAENIPEKVIQDIGR